MNNKKNQVAFVTTYPPRECGIATFTQDLVNELNNVDSLETQKIIAISDNESYSYENQVIFEIEQNNLNSYLETAAKINNSDIDLVCIELEFGIFGGDNGDYVLDFARKLNKPIVTTLHTVLSNPNSQQKFIIYELGILSEKIVTMANNTKEILEKIYNVDGNKISVIHHGVPYRDLPSRDELKVKYGYQGKKVISTFGLLSSGKGIEYAIEAIGKINNEFNDIVYLILGQTHPSVKAKFGEQYRDSLKKLVNDLNIQDKVVFVDKYFDKDELLEYLKLSDIYMTPYLGKEQAVSGTLAYAMGYGKAIVSTPYKYAEELLSNERGILVDFKNSDELAEGIRKILNSENLQNELENNALNYGKNMMWKNVASKYENLFNESIH